MLPEFFKASEVNLCCSAEASHRDGMHPGTATSYKYKMNQNESKWIKMNQNEIKEDSAWNHTRIIFFDHPIYDVRSYKDPRLDFTYGVGTRHFVDVVSNLSHYKMMELTLLRISENYMIKMILLQHEDWVSLAAWRGPSTTTKLRLKRIFFFLNLAFTCF